jgi:hypothetical protein
VSEVMEGHSVGFGYREVKSSKGGCWDYEVQLVGPCDFSIMVSSPGVKYSARLKVSARGLNFCILSIPIKLSSQ